MNVFWKLRTGIEVTAMTLHAALAIRGGYVPEKSREHQNRE
jgi:hypothetical protein